MRLVKLAIAAAATTSLVIGPTAAKAAACQPGAPGCVLPLPGPAPLPTVDTAPPVVDAGVPVEEVGGGFNALPFIIGLVALAAIAAFLLLDEDEEEEGLTP